MGCLWFITIVTQIVFIILKLVSVITWRWLMVFSPTWIFILVIIFTVIIQKLKDWMEGY